MNMRLGCFLLACVFSRCLGSMSLPFVISSSSNIYIDSHFILRAGAGALDEMKEFLRRGANVNARDDFGWTAIHRALVHGHLECVKVLIQANADVTARVDKFGITALHKAVRHNECLKALLETKKVDVNSRDTFGRTALHDAAMDGNLDSVNTLIEADTNVHIRDTDNYTAFVHAASKGHADCMEALIKAKTDINACDKFGRTALFHVLLINSLDCLKILIKQSYWIVPSEEVVSNSRKRIVKVLGAFVGLRNQHPKLDNLKDRTLTYELLSWDKGLQEDLVVVLLDELKKGREIKCVALIRSKDAAVNYLMKKFQERISEIKVPGMQPSMKALLDQTKFEENFSGLVHQGLNERCEELKVKSGI